MEPTPTTYGVSRSGSAATLQLSHPPSSSVSLPDPLPNVDTSSEESLSSIEELVIPLPRSMHEREPTCPECLIRDSSLETLRRHIQETHSGHQEYHVCPHCPKMYKSVGALRRHVKVSSIWFRPICPIFSSSLSGSGETIH